MNKIVTCQNKNISKYCQGGFEITPDDFTFYDKINVPPPTFCPTCRMLRRISSRNQRSLYLRPCSKCSKDIASVFSPVSPFTVYCTECYFKDDWDKGEPINESSLPNISMKEQELFQFIRANNINTIRLEQEKISQEYVLKQIAKLYEAE